MNTSKHSEDEFEILRRIDIKNKYSQRQLAKDLGFSLGKLNYCIRALRDKGLIKIKNFKKNKNKLNYIYVLTAKGIKEKTVLTINFMKKKMKEYDNLKLDLEKNNKIIIINKKKIDKNY